MPKFEPKGEKTMKEMVPGFRCTEEEKEELNANFQRALMKGKCKDFREYVLNLSRMARQNSLITGY